MRTMGRLLPTKSETTFSLPQKKNGRKAYYLIVRRDEAYLSQPQLELPREPSTTAKRQQHIAISIHVVERFDVFATLIIPTGILKGIYVKKKKI